MCLAYSNVALTFKSSLFASGGENNVFYRLSTELKITIYPLALYVCRRPWGGDPGSALRCLQRGTKRKGSRVIEKEEWAGEHGAAGKASSLLQCSTALWPCSPPSCTMCSCFTTWRLSCPSTRSIKCPSGWERWGTSNLSLCQVFIAFI